MALPEIRIWSMDKNTIYLNWKCEIPNGFQSFNLYGCPNYDGVYTLFQEKIANISHPLSPGCVMAKVVKADYGIASDQPYFFKITSIDANNVESNIANSNFISVDPLDVYKHRLSDDFNPVYKNIALTVLNGTTLQFVDIERLLDRQANFVQIRTDQDIKIRWNSSFNDPINISASTTSEPFQQFDRRAITIKSAYIDNTSGSDALVELFVAGN